MQWKTADLDTGNRRLQEIGNLTWYACGNSAEEPISNKRWEAVGTRWSGQGRNRRWSAYQSSQQYWRLLVGKDTASTIKENRTTSSSKMVTTKWVGIKTAICHSVLLKCYSQTFLFSNTHSIHLNKNVLKIKYQQSKTIELTLLRVLDLLLS